MLLTTIPFFKYKEPEVDDGVGQLCALAVKLIIRFSLGLKGVHAHERCLLYTIEDRRSLSASSSSTTN
jgi:hypothetical protein